MTNSDYTRKNLLDGLTTLRERQQQGGIRATPDISDAQFQVNTNQALVFLAGYISHALDRIDELEKKLAQATSND